MGTSLTYQTFQYGQALGISGEARVLQVACIIRKFLSASSESHFLSDFSRTPQEDGNRSVASSGARSASSLAATPPPSLSNFSPLGRTMRW